MKIDSLETSSSQLIASIDWEKVAGLVPAVIQSTHTKEMLMLGYMNGEAITKTIEERRVCFYSRTKQRLWVKGETSGCFLAVDSIHLDCDRDSLLVMATPATDFVCHQGQPTCFFAPFTNKLEQVIEERKKEGSSKSYISSLIERGSSAIAQKIGEEGVEVALASQAGDKEQILEESADLFFHLLVNLHYHGYTFNDVDLILSKRHRGVHGIHQEVK